MTVELDDCFGPDPDEADCQDPGAADDDRVDPIVVEISALFSYPGGHRFAGEFAEDPGFGDGVVRVQGQERSQVTFDGIDAIGGDQDEPVLGSSLAEAAVSDRSRGRYSRSLITMTRPAPINQADFAAKARPGRRRTPRRCRLRRYPPAGAPK